MRHSTRILASGLILTWSANGLAQQQTVSIDRGRASFLHTCAPCHGSGVGDDGRKLLPGTDALRIKYKGALPALLEERTDLTADAIKAFVRRGVFSMPPFRPTEVTDQEIVDIAAYIKQTSSDAAKKKP